MKLKISPLATIADLFKFYCNVFNTKNLFHIIFNTKKNDFT